MGHDLATGKALVAFWPVEVRIFSPFLDRFDILLQMMLSDAVEQV
jgi:hypothetical protein